MHILMSNNPIYIFIHFHPHLDTRERVRSLNHIPPDPENPKHFEGGSDRETVNDTLDVGSPNRRIPEDRRRKLGSEGSVSMIRETDS